MCLKTVEVLAFLKNEVITMLRTVEEDMKPTVPSFIYISHAFYLVMN